MKCVEFVYYAEYPSIIHSKNADRLIIYSLIAFLADKLRRNDIKIIVFPIEIR